MSYCSPRVCNSAAFIASVKSFRLELAGGGNLRQSILQIAELCEHFRQPGNVGRRPLRSLGHFPPGRQRLARARCKCADTRPNTRDTGATPATARPLSRKAPRPAAAFRRGETGRPLASQSVRRWAGPRPGDARFSRPPFAARPGGAMRRAESTCPNRGDNRDCSARPCRARHIVNWPRRSAGHRPVVR